MSKKRVEKLIALFSTGTFILLLGIFKEIGSLPTSGDGTGFDYTLSKLTQWSIEIHPFQDAVLLVAVIAVVAIAAKFRSGLGV